MSSKLKDLANAVRTNPMDFALTRDMQEQTEKKIQVLIPEKEDNSDVEVNDEKHSDVSVPEIDDGFDKLIFLAKSKKYSCSSYIYIDDNIKKTLSLLKVTCNIDATTLVSFVLERWLNENRAEIQNRLNNNKFF